MEYAKARKGLNILFIGTVFEILSYASVGISYFILFSENRFTQDKAVDYVFDNPYYSICLFMVIFFSFTAFILNIVGISTASRAVKSFRGAIAFIIIGIILTFVVSMLSGNRFFEIALDVASVICRFMVYQFVFNGIYDIAEKSKDQRLKELSESSVMPVMTLFILSAVLAFIALLLEVGNDKIYNFVLTGTITPLLMIIAYAFVLRAVRAASKAEVICAKN